MAIDLCVSYPPITIKLTIVTPSQLPDVCKFESLCVCECVSLSQLFDLADSMLFYSSQVLNMLLSLHMMCWLHNKRCKQMQSLRLRFLLGFVVVPRVMLLFILHLRTQRRMLLQGMPRLLDMVFRYVTNYFDNFTVCGGAQKGASTGIPFSALLSWNLELSSFNNIFDVALSSFSQQSQDSWLWRPTYCIYTSDKFPVWSWGMSPTILSMALISLKFK